MMRGPDPDWYREQICQLMIVFKGGVSYHHLIDMPLCEVDALIKEANKYLNKIEKASKNGK